MLRQDLKIELQGWSCSTSGASETMAAARTSTGHLIQVSLHLEKPPGVSRVCLQIPDGRLDATLSWVLAAHGDSMLIEVSIQHTDPPSHTEDHFVYSAGAATADIPRPPSMSLLPSFHVGFRAGLVHHGEDLVVVAHLGSMSSGPDTSELIREADLSLFRSGEWSTKRAHIRFRDASEVLEKIPSLLDAVVPFGDGLLCWVDYSYHLGVVLGDVFEETPRLQYLPLPRENICGEPSNRNVCATAGGDTLKFVNIFPRCCCGGAGASRCQRSCHAYTIETWTMRIGNCDDMGWVKDAIVDSSELWALDSYKGLWFFPLNHPVMSLEQPEVICFWLHEPRVDGHWNYDRTVDVVMVNTRSKTIHSVSSCDDGLLSLSGMHDGLFTSNVSYFFNSCHSSGSGATFTGQRQLEEIDRPRPVIRDDIARNPTMLSESSVQASEIIEVFQEIPTYVLDDDEVKAYRFLRRDNCRGFRSLLRLPKNLRKDWLLMEMKASED